MGHDPGLVPTRATSNSEYQRWSAVYAGDQYYYGSDAGPVARRAVRYHRQYRPRGGAALDAGCGEGQDLAYLAEQGYVATGVEFTEAGAAKAERLLRARGLEAEILREDLKAFAPPRKYDLVLAVNSLQFMGHAGEECLTRLIGATTPGGVFGISMFARPAGMAAGGANAASGIWLITLEELLAHFAGWQMLEVARLWQWNPHTNEPQPFVTLVARNTPAAPPPFPLP
jgi:SAM-dependent methyltransferase